MELSKEKDKASKTIIRGDIHDLVELDYLMTRPHKVLFHTKSQYQDILLLETKELYMYIDGRLQFSSSNERRFYEIFIHPPFSLARSRKNILMIGGDNGFAIREILKYPDVDKVDLLIDEAEVLNAAMQIPQLIELNEKSLQDRRVTAYQNDSFLDQVQEPYDVIILELPEPIQTSISKLYTQEFFSWLADNYLSPNGLLICNSHSPKNEPSVFWSIGATLQKSGLQTISYQEVIPYESYEGFHIASRKKIKFDHVILSMDVQTLPKDVTYLFEFSTSSKSAGNKVMVNTMDNLVLTDLYQKYIPTSIDQNVNKKRHNQLENRFRILQNGIEVTDKEKTIDLEEQTELNHLLASSPKVVNETKGKNLLIFEATDRRMYLDKQLQFSSIDEKIYHEALVHPALSAIQQRDRVLILGGGDGFAVREVLKYPDVRKVDLVDLDAVILNVAKDTENIARLNHFSLSDPRVRVRAQDAQKFIQKDRKQYQAIIIDFPDPADKIISKLYTKEFFQRLYPLLAENGLIVCQSFSPKNAPRVYWSIGATMKEAGMNVLSYHVYVPSFDDWGFHLAGLNLPDPSKINSQVKVDTLPADYSTLFTFPKQTKKKKKLARVNSLDNLCLYQLYQREVTDERERNRFKIYDLMVDFRYSLMEKGHWDLAFAI